MADDQRPLEAIVDTTEPIVDTGIDGLEAILHGGLVGNRLYLLEGRPGSGKTTLVLQFLLAGVAVGGRCVYVTLSETLEELKAMAQTEAIRPRRLAFDSTSELRLLAQNPLRYRRQVFGLKQFSRVRIV